MRLNKFIKNSDYTAEKQKLDFTLTLPNQSISVGASAQSSRYVDFEVPKGTYFENVTWQQTRQTGMAHYVGNFLEFEPSDQMSVVTYTVAQVTPTKYRLMASVMNWDFEASHSFNIGATAKIHLSVAPF